jgi:membrane protein implicated in regulation of membrane protease activity
MPDGVHHPEQEPAPPPGEAIHLPGPSYLPVLTAFGISLALVGVVISFVLTAIGAVIAIVAIVRWVRETREEMSELPLEH